MFFVGSASDERDFNVFNLDLRNYFSRGSRHVFATQVFLYGVEDGNAPFWRMATLGGRAHTRGYRYGRYIDRVLLAFQGEYRLHAFWRVGLVTFAGLSDVASKIATLKLEHMRPTIGIGARFHVSSPEGIRGRVDMALGQKSLRFYLRLDEAF
jgi:outer membrane translocation and assembly module TamA